VLADLLARSHGTVVSFMALLTGQELTRRRLDQQDWECPSCGEELGSVYEGQGQHGLCHLRCAKIATAPGKV
jgi:hypothetical protein